MTKISKNIGPVAPKAKPVVSTPKNDTPTTRTSTAQVRHNQDGFEAPRVSAGDLGTGATIAGAPVAAATNLAEDSTRVVRGYASAARANAAQIFAEGGETALRSSGAHRAVANLETAASRSAQTASRLNNTGRVLGVAGGALTAIDQGVNSTAQTDTGRVISGTAAGTASYALGASHPYLAAADAVANLAGVPETPSNILNNSIDTLVTVGESAVTGDLRGVESLHQRNLSGENGPVFQAAAEAGDFWAERGIVGGLSDFGNAVLDLF
jgi:hypothetical protein